MESTNTQMQTPQGGQKRNSKGLIILIFLLVVALFSAGAAIVVLANRKPEAPEAEKIGYSESVVVLDNNKPVDLTPPEAISLEYKGQAVSTDGKTFQCHIVNAAKNQYDMYIDIYSDAALTDEIFLSELFRPGTGFEEITLNRTLEKGVHTVYLVFTQVEDDHSTIHNQTAVTYNLIVQ